MFVPLVRKFTLYSVILLLPLHKKRQSQWWLFSYNKTKLMSIILRSEILILENKDIFKIEISY